MKILNTKFLSKAALVALLLSLPMFISSQSLDVEMLGDALAKKLTGSGPSIDTKADGEYKSFIKNQYSNTVSQHNVISKQIEQDLFLSKLQQERLELASKLCSKDPRSCFLIDEYQEYSQENTPKAKNELKIFGLDMFAAYPNSINTYESIPVADDYILKPGDEININITGSLNLSQEVPVSPSGIISINEVGDILLAGLTIKQAALKLEEFVQSRYLGAETFLNIGKLTLNQVFALGAVNFPGSYNISPMSSVINSLISSGGFKQNASLRDIEIIRNGETIQTIDLYNFLISGNTNLEWRLRSGDAILVNGTSEHVAILGEINRPAIYQIQSGELLSDVIRFALGFTPFADQDRITIKRINVAGNLDIFNVTANSPFELFPGDSIEINSKQGNEINIVKVHGAIKSAGDYKYVPNITLGNVINLETDLLDSSYTLFGAVKRFDELTRSYSVFNFNLISQEALNSIPLQSKDEIFVFNKDAIYFINSRSLREQFNSISKKALGAKPKQFAELSSLDIGSSLEEASYSNLSPSPSSLSCLESMNNIKNDDIQKNLSNKLNFFNSLNISECPDMLVNNPELLPILLANSIPVLGNVRHPGLLPITNNILFAQIFSYAGGLSNTNFSSYAEAASYGEDPISFELSNPPGIKKLAYVNIKTRENIYQSKFVTLIGEFSSPGVYPINSNTSLLDIYERAGGVTSQAYPYAAILSREAIKRSEELALIRTRAELTELMTGAVASGYLKQSSTDLIPLISLISNVENANPSGRLVTELNPRVVQKDTSLNIFLENGDVIYMPRMNSTITISGSVLNPVTVPYKPGMSFKQYIKIAGGYKSNADKSKVYAIKPNGEAMLAQATFSIFTNDSILPGTTIIVPSKVRVFDGLALVEVITPVLANLPVTAASIAAISNNN